MNMGQILQLYQGYFEDVTKGQIIFPRTIVTNYHKLGSLKPVTSQKLAAWGSPRCHQSWACPGGSGEGSSSPPVGFGAVTCWAVRRSSLRRAASGLGACCLLYLLMGYKRGMYRAHPAKPILKSFLPVISAQTPFPCEVQLQVPGLSIWCCQDCYTAQ